MSDQEHTSHLTNSQEDHTNSWPHTLAAECTPSSPPVLDQSQPKQPQHLAEASPRSNPSHSDSECTLIEPDLSLHPAITTSLGPDPAAIDQASLTSPSTTQVELPSQQLPDLKRRRSSASSSQAHTPPSIKTGPTASQIARYTELDRHHREQLARLNKRAADEDCHSDRDDISQSCSDSDTSQLDMATNPESVREELKLDFMFINKGHLDDLGNANFKKLVTKVMETDRTSAVSKKEMERFDKKYEKYQYSNEATFVHMLLPIMMGDEFTAQDVNEDGQGEGDYKEREFVDQGVVCAADRLFNTKYCLPHRDMYVPDLSDSLIKARYDSQAHLTTPKPDFVYGLSDDSLPPRPLDVMYSDEVRTLLKVAPIREVFFVWENKSGGGNILKCGNDALKDTAALINARRKLYALMGHPKKPGIDEATYMYAAINTHEKIEYYVAYAWLPEDLSRVEFCMDKIGRDDFTTKDVKDNGHILPSLRKPLHNIIEWGSVVRRPKLKLFYDELWTVERARTNKSRQEAKEKETSPQKKQKVSH